MKTRTIDIITPEGICDAFAAYPQDTGQYAAVLLIMDAFGLREYLYEMAKTLASQGYYVLLPNMFYRLSRAPVKDIKFPICAQDMPKIREQMMIKSYFPCKFDHLRA